MSGVTSAIEAMKAITGLSQRELNNALDILCVFHPDDVIMAVEQARATTGRRLERASSACGNLP